MLKITISLQMLAADELCDIEGSVESKCVKPKIGRSETQKSATSQKLSKSRKLKKLSKSGNPSNFDATEARSSFLTPNIRTVFNCLRLTFTKASIFLYFDLKCYLRIETYALDYVIGGLLSQLSSRISSDRVVSKTDLSQ